MNKAMKGEVGIQLFFLAVVVFIFWLFWHFVIVIGWMPNYSDGERTGQFYKFSRKGVFYKSWEGSMYLGGVSTVGTGQNAQLQLDKFMFSIPASEEAQKANVIAKAQECASKRLTCTVKYQQWLKSPIDVDQSYIVQDIILPQ